MKRSMIFIIYCVITLICYVYNNYAGRRMEVHAINGSDPYVLWFANTKLIATIRKQLRELKFYDKASAFTLCVDRMIDAFGKSICYIKGR